MMDERYELKLLAETDKGLKVSDGDVEVWLPSALVQEISRRLNKETGEEIIILEIPEWLATCRGLC